MSAATSPGTGLAYGLRRVCAAWGLARSSFYAMTSGQNAERPPANRGPKPAIRRMAVMNLVCRDIHTPFMSTKASTSCSRRWPVAPSRSVPSGWWKRPVFRWPCRQQPSAWRDHRPRRSASFTARHSRQGAQNGLTKLLSRHAVPSTPRSCRYGWPVLENTLGHLSQAEGIVKLPVGEQPGIRGDLGTVEFKLQSTVKNDPKAPRFRFTHRVCHIRRSMYATTS